MAWDIGAWEFVAAGGAPFVDNSTATLPIVKPPSLGSVFIAGSLLLTTLAPQLIPLPLSADQGALVSLQAYHPGHNLTLNADTSHGTAKVLYVDAATQAKNLPFYQADRVRPVVDTSYGTPISLFPTGLPAGMATPQSAPAKFWYQPRDTSNGMPKVAYGDAVTPVFNVPQFQLDRVRPVVDTSKSTATNLLPVALPAGQSTPQSAPQRYWFQPADASKSVLLALNVLTPAPIVNAPQYAPYRFWYQPTDTSQSSPKAMYGDAATPRFNPPQHHVDPSRFRYLPADTGKSVAKVLYADVVSSAYNENAHTIMRQSIIYTSSTALVSTIAFSGGTMASTLSKSTLMRSTSTDTSGTISNAAINKIGNL
jgi:hypothetical protein